MIYFLRNAPFSAAAPSLRLLPGTETDTESSTNAIRATCFISRPPSESEQPTYQPAASPSLPRANRIITACPSPPTNSCSPWRPREREKKGSPTFARRNPPPQLMYLGRAAAIRTSEANKPPSSSRLSDLPFLAPSTPWFRELRVNASK